MTGTVSIVSIGLTHPFRIRRFTAGSLCSLTLRTFGICFGQMGNAVMILDRVQMILKPEKRNLTSFTLLFSREVLFCSL